MAATASSLSLFVTGLQRHLVYNGSRYLLHAASLVGLKLHKRSPPCYKDLQNKTEKNGGLFQPRAGPHTRETKGHWLMNETNMSPSPSAQKLIIQVC